MSKTIGEKIRDRRIELEMSQEELAKKCGYKSRSSIQKIECSRDLPLKKAKTMAEALDLPLSYLLEWEEFASEEHEPSSKEDYYLSETSSKLADMMKENEGYQVLFETVSKVPPESISQVEKMIKLMLGDEQ